MTDIDVLFMHPTNRGTISVTVDNSMTVKEIIEQLIENNFVPRTEAGYTLSLKGNNQVQLNPDSTLAGAGVVTGSTLAVNPHIQAGHL